MQWGVITQRVKGRWLIIRLERQAGCLTHQGSMREAEPLRALGSKILTIKTKSSLQRAYTFSSGAESGSLWGLMVGCGMTQKDVVGGSG